MGQEPLGCEASHSSRSSVAANDDLSGLMGGRPRRHRCATGVHRWEAGTDAKVAFNEGP